MGAALAEASRTARDVFEEVDEALGQKLFQLMREGPEDELKLTENAQPAIMANSLAVFRVADEEGGVASKRRASSPATASANIPRCAPRARSTSRHREAAEAARPGDAGGGPGRRGRDGALLGADLEMAQTLADAAAEGEVCTSPTTTTRAGRDLGPQGRDRARGRAGQGHGHQARGSAAGLGAVPLPADAARRRGDGARRSSDVTSKRRGAALRQRHRPAGSRPRTSRGQLVEQVTGRVRWRESVPAWPKPASSTSSSSAARCSARWSSAPSRCGGDERGDDGGHRSAGEGTLNAFPERSDP